jgi:Protein of unknown function (DUF2004)
MASIETNLFGRIEFNPTSATLWRGTIMVNGDSNAISLYIGDGLSSRMDLLSPVFEMLEGIDLLDTRARAALLEDMKGSKSGIVAGFINCHLNELDDKLLKQIFVGINLTKVSKESLLTRLELRAIGIHLEEPSEVSVNLDYSFNPEFSDELLVARFRNGGQELSLAHES